MLGSCCSDPCYLFVRTQRLLGILALRMCALHGVLHRSTRPRYDVPLARPESAAALLRYALSHLTSHGACTAMQRRIFSGRGLTTGTLRLQAT